MIHPPSLKRAASLFGVSFLLMMVISVAFYYLKPEGAAINIPWLSVSISIFAVALPAVVACYWPREGAPGALPSFHFVDRWLLGGAALLSLPLYVVFATLQIAASKLFAMPVESGLVEPLTAGSPLAFAWIWLAVAFFPAFTEETMYRGLLQSAAVRRWGPWVGLIAASFFFSLAHLEPAGFLSRILMGLWFGYLFLRTGSILPGAIAHTLNNSWGVVLANWGTQIEPQLPWVYALATALLLAGLACLYKAGLFKKADALPAGEFVPEHQVPRVVTVSRPPETQGTGEKD
ncbi:MAG: CPBP family intramembrane glutamic endopeptidase [Candidatus Sericytochromatia bacterium]